MQPDPSQDAVSREKPDYGVDGWVYVVALLVVGSTASVAAVVLLALRLTLPGALLGALGALALVPALLGVQYVKRGKFRHCDRILARVPWRGDEHVLDVGTGGGLLAIAAAKRAGRGRAVGIDVWSAEDLSNNTPARARKNAALEQVAARVEVRDDDARHLSFADEVFDVVVSMLCLHNIAGGDDRRQALHEIVRVLKPGGRALISDLANAEEYARVLTALGLEVTVSPPVLDTFPFQRLVDARKAGGR